MKAARKIILYLTALIGTWLLVSFGGAMFNGANAAFWSDSLMWSLLSFMIIAPALVFISTSFAGDSSSARASRKSFVESPEKRQETLGRDQKDHEDWNSTLTGDTSGRSTRARA